LEQGASMLRRSGANDTNNLTPGLMHQFEETSDPSTLNLTSAILYKTTLPPT